MVWSKIYGHGARYVGLEQDLWAWNKICRHGARFMGTEQALWAWSKICGHGARFMGMEQDFLLLYTYYYGKNSFETWKVFRRRLPHKMIPHCTSTYQVIYLNCVNTGKRENVDWQSVSRRRTD